MNTKGLSELVLAGALALGIAGCDERKDFLLKEGKLGEYKVKVIREVIRSDLDYCRIELYDSNGNLKFNVRKNYFESQDKIQFDKEDVTPLDLFSCGW